MPSHNMCISSRIKSALTKSKDDQPTSEKVAIGSSEKAGLETPAKPGLESDAQSASNDPPPPYVDDSAVHTYDVKYKDWKSVKALVIDTETGTETHQFDLPTIFRGKTIFKSAEDQSEIGEAQFNPFKSKLNIKLHNHDLELKLKKRFGTDYSYESAAFGGETMSWEFHSGWADIYYVLTDGHGLPVARWTARGPTVFKDLGKVEFLGSKAESAEAKEEVFLTGVTLVYLMIYSRGQLA